MTSKEKKRYRSTKKWIDFRLIILEKYNSTCNICGIKKKKGLNVHHKDEKTYTKETVKDVVLLCKSCHKEIHRLLRRKTLDINKLAINLKKIYKESC